MTIERLETIAADLYKGAEEATPIIGGADKKDWMARRLEEIIEADEPALGDFLNCETTDQVIALLDIEYDDYKNGDEIEDDADLMVAPDNMNDLIVSDQNGVLPENRIVRPVEEILIPDEDVLNRDDVVASAYDSEEDISVADKAPKAEKETGVKDELPDPYVDDRADQPEFIDNDPNYFDEALIVEEDIIFVNDVTGERSDPLMVESDLDVDNKCSDKRES